jgi:hypothetical protein
MGIPLTPDLPGTNRKKGGYKMAFGSSNENKLYFETSYIARSPCRECALENSLPDCSKDCRTLSQVRALMAGIISRPSEFPEYEEYALML